MQNLTPPSDQPNSSSKSLPTLQPRDFSIPTSSSNNHTPIPVYKGNPFRPAPGMPIPERIKVAFEKLNSQTLKRKSQAE